MAAVLSWYTALFITGIAFMPLLCRVFKPFADKGYIFARSIGILLFAFIIWVLNILHIIKFRPVPVILCACGIIVIAAVVTAVTVKRGCAVMPDIRMIITEEILFAVMFFLWVYIIGFKPEAYGTEKFMDLGFITSALRSDYMPFSDMWMSGSVVNYYYGGQFITALMVRLTGVTAGEGYSLMRATVASMSYVLPFSLVANIVSQERNRKAAYASGAISGLAVAFCGNGHYIIYGLILPVIYKIRGYAGYSYWFPRSTRFIGYDPDIPDKTIHEFPAYSTILGDLHAHYINIIFTVSVLAVAAAYVLRKDKRSGYVLRKDKRSGVFAPEIILCGVMTGLFRWINYWDLPICFVVCVALIFIANIRRESLLKGMVLTAVQAVVMYAAGYIASLPFTLFFKNDYTKIGITHSHSMLYQLGILWGFPVLISVVFIICLFKKYGKKIMRSAPSGDLIMCVLAVCAAGLVLLPELVFVKDIYGDDFYRANTMFKLTYQAFIMFGMAVGYILCKGAYLKRGSRALKVLCIAGICVLVLSAGYSINGISAWFGNIFNIASRESADAYSFVAKELPDDLYAIRFLDEYAQNRDVVILEATDASYSDAGRVSVATGIPTVLGWYGHEQLWRGESPEVKERWHDISHIYSAQDPDEAAALIDKYDIDLIYVGQVERERYQIDDSVIMSLGTVVYEDEFTYIVETSDQD